MDEVRILPAGDRALIVEFGKTIDEKINARVQALAEGLRAAPLRGMTEYVPTYRSLLVCFDPKKVRFETLSRRLLARALRTAQASAASGRLLRLPCCYNGEDLEGLSQLTGLAVDEIVRIHSAPDYPIYMLGFLPGFVYLGGLDARIAAPRLATPRKVIPAGSVGIGGSQTGVYPMDSPGGWRLIGRTPVPLYDPKRADPILCRAGDRIRFAPINQARFDALTVQLQSGAVLPEAFLEGGADE